ncbi:TatD family deoxyribonuclease [Aureimonas fodinaquatilis]|uniref:TatD family deoxyribonuclease n=1 Tax=Aureimonas fodinaquatilis TaxID=2565783 RepID=A0A5B0DVI8_9HYPH|nr:TatD family hydrolase [Aureimonas fodinaquatilis]KAA0970368.1 TatD family deoxyribonuclease [Aureimonas fodinaquatilis]
MNSLFIVDSHCHLDFPDFDEDRDLVVQRAAENGVKLLLTISTTVAKIDTLLALTERYANVFATVGTHPNRAADEPDVPAARLIELASKNAKIVGIGEAGLDYYYDKATPQTQERVFREHIAAARQTGLPLVIHARSADEDMERILTEETAIGAFPFVLHCFSSGKRLADVGVELGGYVSFSGILAFNRSLDIREIADGVPLDRLLVETDAPYLAPPPYRGKRNEPGYTRYTAEVLATVKDVDLPEIARATSDNFFRLFSKTPDLRTL